MIILLKNKSLTGREKSIVKQKEFSLPSSIMKSIRNFIAPINKRDGSNKIKNPLVLYARDQKARRIRANRKLGIDLKTNVPKNPKLNQSLTKEITKDGENWVLDNNGWYKFQNNVARESAAPVNRVTLGINNLKYTKISPKDCIDLSESKALLAAKTKKNIINLEGSLLDSTTPMSHEYGHILNSKNPRTKKVGMRIRRLQNQENKTTSNRFFGKAKSTWNIARLNNSIVSEEKNAWKNGINALKRNGATSEDLKYTNKYKNAALDTYKSSRNLKIVSKVYDMFKSKNSVNPIESLMKDRKYKWNAVDLGSNL